MKINTIIQGDCLEVMKKMPKNSIDLAWTDPPYNVEKDYGKNKDNLSDKEYLSWLKKVIAELKRVSGNKIAIMVPHKYYLDIWSLLGKDYKQIILSYSPEGAIRFGFVNQFTGILTNIKPLGYCKNVWNNCQMPGLGWFFREDNYGHPGYTSEDITSRIVGWFSKEKDLILDPFMGVGTTGVVARRLKRNYIGIEINPDYCKTAEERIKGQTPPLL